MMTRMKILVAGVFLSSYLILLAIKIPSLDAFIYTFTVLTIYVFLSRLTRRINFLDVTAMVASISYLLMPLITYKIFDQGNKLASLWRTFMTIDQEKYFAFALPGTLALVLGLWCPSLIRISKSDTQLMDNVKLYLSNKKGLGYILIIIGLSAVPLVQLAPLSLRAIFYFVSQLTYVGFIYLLYSRLHLKSVTIAFIVGLMLIQSVITGMYGELVFWTIMGSILLMINNTSFTLFRRVVFMALGITFIFLIQSVKQDYREVVWQGEERRNDPELFFSLFLDRFRNPKLIFDSERVYKVVVRGNQGYLVARTMAYVPKHEPFAQGETILMSFLSAVVPRFLWQDKPKVGGQSNICRFLGDCGQYNYSYNIGQLGEAYVNFGKTGGCIYMFFYGLMLSTLFNLFRYLSQERATLILWTPILFYPALIVETDLLTFINTFVKGAFFCWVCYFSIRLLFKIRI